MTRRARIMIGLSLVVGATAGIAGSCGSEQGNAADTATDAAADASKEVESDDAGADGAVNEDAGAEADTMDEGDGGAESCIGDVAPAWVLDSAVWKDIPATSFTQASCTVTEANAASLPLPVFEWQPCGPGCETTDPAQGLGSGAYRPQFFLAGNAEHNEAYLTIEHDMTCATRTVGLLRVVRVSDGATIAALKIDQNLVPAQPIACDFGFDGTVFTVMMIGAQAMETYARVPLDGGPFTWASPPVPFGNEPGAQIFGIDYHGGSLVAVGGVVAISDDPTSNGWRVLESPSGSIHGAGEGDLAVWTDQAQPGLRRIRGWAPDGKEVRDIVVGLTEQTKDVAISWDRIVGFAGEVDNQGFFTRLKVWTTPRAYDTSQAHVTTSPELVNGRLAVGFPYMVTSGDFVMASVVDMDAGGSPAGPSWFLLVNLNTFEGWRLDPQPGRAWTTRTLALTHSHLYAADNLGGGAESLMARHIYRFDLSQVSSWAKPLQ